jgi:hypothetical protein
MKARGWVLLVVGAVAVGLLSGCSGQAGSEAESGLNVIDDLATPGEAGPATEADVAGVADDGTTRMEASGLATARAPVSLGELTAEEAAGLVFMRAEEKLAHDLYTAWFAAWGMVVFENIADSEVTHTAAVQTLLEQYGLEDPAAASAPGEFPHPALQALYDQLLPEGRRSLADALRVGAAVAEIDLLDPEERSAQTDKLDILTLYESLAIGSRNHLRSFVSVLERQTSAAYQAAQILC